MIGTPVRALILGGLVAAIWLGVARAGQLLNTDLPAPPIASRIAIASVDPVGNASIVGSPGAVPARNYVICVTLETGQYAITQAGADGSFTATLFAPAGSSILVKPDPGRLLSAVAAGEAVIDHHFNELISLPGTIVRVPDPPSSPGEIAFGAAGVTRTNEAFATWGLRGSLPKTQFRPGETLSVRLNLTTRAPSNPSPPARVRAQLSLVALAGSDGIGRHAQNSFCSTVLTPTGLPIERFQWLFTSYQADEAAGEFIPVGPDSIRADLQMSLPLREDLIPGYYRPAMAFSIESLPMQPLAGARMITFIDVTSRGASAVYLPIIRIGDPRPPRLFWTLMMNAARQGARGVVAVEDRARFGIAPHIITSSERMVVPRVDPRSGRPITYNFEPFVPTVALSDRGAPPAAPLIPFRFPSGQLNVTIRAPDGSVSILGPVTFRQERLIGPAHNGGSMEGGGYITDPYQLTTLDPQFDVQFTSEGLHRIELQGTVEDIWGNVWSGGGTYEVEVARDLVLDPFVVPGTLFEVGDSFGPGLLLQPPVPAEVELRLRFAPGSDPARIIERRMRGRANRFGVMTLGDSAFRFTEPGEYRADLSAVHQESSGARWVGLLTWGGAVAPRVTRIVAHGRRGTDDQQENRQAWFLRTQTGLTFGRGHVQIPFHSGDVMWMEDPDAATPNISFQDPQGSIPQILNRYCCGPRGDDAAGETLLFSASFSGLDVHLSPAEPEVVGYSYRAVERPLVRVREIIGEDHVAAPYWRFDDLYGLQSGTGANGDLPNDFKFQFAGVVLRGSAIGEPLYAIYGSLFILVPEHDVGGGTRIFPPFQGNGGGPSGGPIMALKGKPIDIFFHPTGVRPGTILEVGNLVSFVGQIGPTLPSKVRITVTSPSGRVRQLSGQANKVGYFYQPASDFSADEPGIWKAKVTVWHDGLTSAGQVTEPFPTGDVLGSREGEFYFYVVSRQSPPLELNIPQQSFVRPAERPVSITVTPPAGLRDVQLSYTTMMPGFVLEEGVSSNLTYTYDAVKLHGDFPNLDLMDADGKAGVDTITMSFFAEGTDDTGKKAYRARQLTLQGEQLLAPPQPPTEPCANRETSLCLNAGRFEVRATWRTMDGRSGAGRAVPLTSDTGYFWFFSQDNVEIVLKVLDACGLPGFESFWVFAAGLTDVETEITVTDTYTGLTKIYTNPLGRAFRPILDTEGFRVCAVGSSPSASMSVDLGEEAGFSTETDYSSAACTPGGTRLCLSDGRFQVEAFWKTASAEGDGHAVGLTGDTGYFWFFNPDNLEVVVKVLNACSFSAAPRYWVFGAGLTDVEVELRVTDTRSGQIRTYRNPLGTPFAPIQDTDAFATCPGGAVVVSPASADLSALGLAGGYP